MKNAKVFIFAPADPSGTTHRRLESAGCEVVLGLASWKTPQGDNEKDMVEMARNADALAGTSIRSSPITRDIMAAAPKLRVVAKASIGVDDVDVEAATDLGVLVTHSPLESNWSAVAESSMAMILTLLKKSRERDEAMKRGEWRDPKLQGIYLGKRQDGYPGLTVGLVGLGRIGTRLAGLFAPWRMRVLACDPYIDPAKFILSNVERADLETLLKESDIVSLHVTLTPETRHLISTAELAMMKENAVLINTARGQVVDEKALAHALDSGIISAAALDVFESEPLPGDSPLLNMGHKVLLSPHMASSNIRSGILSEGVECATRAVLAALAGEVPENVLNKEIIPKWLERFGGKSLLCSADDLS